MATTFHKQKTPYALLVLLALLALAGALFPWKPWLERRITAALEAQGLRNVHLTVSRVGLTSLALENLSFGGTPPLTLKNVALSYSVADLFAGRVRRLELNGLNLEARRTNGQWAVAGIKTASPPSKPPLSLPVALDELASFPFDEARFDNGTLRLITDTWRLDAPLQVTLTKTPSPVLTAASGGAEYSFQNIKTVMGSFSAEISLNPGSKKWQGPWHLKNVNVTGGGAAIPSLDGNGTLTAEAGRIAVQGRLKSTDQSVSTNFRADYFLHTPDQSKLVIAEASMPWHEGTLSTREVVVPFGEKKPLTATLNIHRVSAGTLLRELTGGKASATGSLSGVLPVTVLADGTVLVHQGSLEAEGPGVLSLPPDVIPGDQEQVAFVRNVLGNFHYSLLTLRADSDKNNKLSLLMTLQGQNPDVSLGRPVKVNVRLTGDVLGFVRQNLLWLTNPATFLEQGEHAKK